MIYGFVQQSGGHVLLNSKQGHGTTVAIYLPRFLGDEGAAQETEAIAQAIQAEPGIVILLVEDEPAVRQVMADILIENGYQIIEAENGISAMHHIQSSARIDLLVSDVGLPGGMNGRQLADAARQHRPSLKVLFVTGYAEQAMVRTELKEIDMEVISKPFNIEAFASKVHKMLTKNQNGVKIDRHN
jgi:DNA-binding NtrC family response regulator